MRFSVVNIGCKVNRVEVDAAAAELCAQGAQLVQNEPADIVVVNTCTVTAEADKKTRKAVRQVLKGHPDAQILVTGCAAVMNPQWFEELDPRVHVVAKPLISACAWEFFSGAGPAVGPAAGLEGEGSMLKQSSLGGTAHWAVPVAAELRVEPSPSSPATDTEVEKNSSMYEQPSEACDVILGSELVGQSGDGGLVERASGSVAETGVLDNDLGQRFSAIRGSSVVGAAGGSLDRIPLRTGVGFRTRVGVKAQDGCNNACTFCIVHVARGASTSVPFERVVAEARAHAQAGVRELLLTGINLGAYDDAGRTLPQLLRALLIACPESRIRIGSVEPLDVSDELIELMAESDGRICRHLHLPLQSGNSRVLTEMNRPYDAEFFLNLVKKMRTAMPSFSLSTDIIVGFPGESDEDFVDTMEVARASAFSKIHVFRYSRREGTPAAERRDQVDSKVSANRAQQLQDLGNLLRIQDAQSRIGTFEGVLSERPGRGLTESYHPVRWNADAALVPLEVGQLRCVALTDVTEDGIFLL